MKITTICLVRHGETDWNVIEKLQGRPCVESDRRRLCRR